MNTQLRLAFIGDIHGNLPALEATLDDLRQQSADAVYVLGDLVNRCPWNNEVMALLLDRDWPTIQGNHDLIIGDLNTEASRPPFTERQSFPVIYWTWEQLEPAYIAYLRQLPHDLHLSFDQAPPLHLFHGVPGNSFIGVTPEMADDQIAEVFEPFAEPVIICAHTHRPLDRRVEGKRVLNGGSVGMPYNSDPRAQYLLLDLVGAPGQLTWQPIFRQVSYDRTDVPDAFHRSGMLDQAGPVSELYMRTVLTGEPWVSDFSYWIKDQPPEIRADIRHAVESYLRHHGPENWAFFR
jgi:predicted phosphodiesterase